ncbi:hypothetical protein OH77DRAFT_950802 [Trametes cingulata]|nr:hypothetical protein OH77DRAFT_950802 [Trametes cingulata]
MFSLAHAAAALYSSVVRGPTQAQQLLSAASKTLSLEAMPYCGKPCHQLCPPIPRTAGGALRFGRTRVSLALHKGRSVALPGGPARHGSAASTDDSRPLSRRMPAPHGPACELFTACTV